MTASLPASTRGTPTVCFAGPCGSPAPQRWLAASCGSPSAPAPSLRAASVAADRPLPVKVGQVTGMAAAGVVSVGAPTAVAVIGRAFYWVIEWLVAVPWYLFERARGLTTNLPWPKGKKRERLEDPPKEYLLVIPKRSPEGAVLAGMLSPNGGDGPPSPLQSAAGVSPNRRPSWMPR